MNKRIAKPKRSSPLIPGESVSEAEMERYLCDNRSSISRKLAAAKRQSDAGMGRPAGLLEDLLADCRKAAKRRP